MITIKEGMQDTEMHMWEQFKEAVEAASSHKGLGLSAKDAAMLVAYRERTSVLDHRLCMLERHAEEIVKMLKEKDKE